MSHPIDPFAPRTRVYICGPGADDVPQLTKIDYSDSDTVKTTNSYTFKRNRATKDGALMHVKLPVALFPFNHPRMRLWELQRARRTINREAHIYFMHWSEAFKYPTKVPAEKEAQELDKLIDFLTELRADRDKLAN